MRTLKPFCGLFTTGILALLLIATASPGSSAEPKKPAGEATRPAAEPGKTPKEPSKSSPTDEQFGSGKATDSPTGEAGKAGIGKKSASPSTDAQRESKLEVIEGKLKDLLREVESLRGKPAPDAAKPKDSAPPPPKPGAKATLPESWQQAITWRSIGPANMGGRIVDLAVSDTDSSMYWAATASGGLLKTSNNGITFTHQFDKENTVSIGAAAVAPSDPNIVWVGTGENNPRNSVSFGDGVYKSSDGGKTWTHMGLKETFQIGRILIDPKNPNIVYVGALGRLYGPHQRRGLFRTTDGGKSWDKVLYVDDNTGVIDMQMHPADSKTLIVAMWQRQRDAFDSWPGSEVPKPDGHDGFDPSMKWGAGSGLYKTSDGGRTWRKLTRGLPTGQLGRIGIDWYRKDPRIVYAIVDGENIGKGPKPATAYLGIVGQDAGGKARVAQILPDSPASKAGIQIGDVILRVDGQSLPEFDKLLDRLRERKPGDKIKLAVSRGSDTREFEATLSGRPGSPEASRLWLGASGETREERAVLTQIVADAPAAKAGLQVNDVVLSVDDEPVSDFGKMIDVIRSHQAGDKVTLKIARGQETKSVVVTLENRPGSGRPSSEPPSDVHLGIRGEDTEGGARITGVSEGGPAEKAGLQEGDVVQAVAGKPIANYAALAEQIRTRNAADQMQMMVRRGEATLEIVATLETRPGANRPYSFSLGGQALNAQDQQGSKGFEYGGVYRSDDAGETWTRVNSLNSRPMYFSQIRVDPSDDQRVYVLGVAQYRSANGGVTFEPDFGKGVHADGHALWIDPRDGRHMLLGTDGGLYVTYDRGANWDHLNHAAIGQFYHVAIARKQPYQVTGGLQDNGTWLGPSLSKSGSGPINEDWIAVGGSDGFMCRVDPEDPDLVYFTAQNGVMSRRNLRTGQSAPIRPQRPKGAPSYRFNWNTPFILSQHNSQIFWCAGNYVFRSIRRGDNLQVMSPEITLTKRGSATALAESPRNPDVLYVGTDDGALWVTRDGGRQWQDVTKRIGLPQPRWVATIEPSRFEEGRVYVALDGHRSDDDDPYVFVSEDFGQTWKSLRANLPWGSTRCVREDLRNPNLLYAGTEFAAWCSIDRGQTWSKMNTNLPTVAIHEFAQHPESGELVVATHGRSLWICDVSVLRQIRPDHFTDRAVLYAPEPVVRWHREPSRGRTNRRFVGQNPPAGAQIYYALPKKADKVTLQIMDIKGDVVRELNVSGDPGLHRVTWDLTQTARKASATAPARPGGSVAEGAYRLVLDADGQPFTQVIRIERDPTAPATASGGVGGVGDEEHVLEERKTAGRPWNDD